MRCPPEYYNNCSVASVKCGVCKAGHNKSGKLEYKPVDPDPKLSEHPAGVKSHRNREASKRGRLNEKIIQRSIDRHSGGSVTIRHNAGSGSVNGDGDLTVSTPTRNFRVEAKHRGSLRRWYLTDIEYKKGCVQGVELYAITRTNPDTGLNETMYMMSEATLIDLLEGSSSDGQ